MVKKERVKDSVVKIDFDLLNRVEEFVSKEENRLKFTNKKQLVNLAVFEFLNKFDGGKDDNR